MSELKLRPLGACSSRFSVSPAARCPGTTSWRQFTRRKSMKKAAVVLLMLVAVMMIAPAAVAQGGGDQGKAPLNPTTLALAARLGVAIAAGYGGPGDGRIAAASCVGNAPDAGAA